MPTFLEVPMAEILKRMDLIVTIAVVAVVLMIIVPLPTVLLDLFLAFNITVSMVILLISMYTKNSLEFSIFPSVLLITTLLRLALNISSTRLILLYGNKFDGQVIKAFGNFVVGGNYVVGIVIFLIITVIQFIVITKGAGRVAEVAARFTLDAMPGKQMSIDADLNAGVINDEDARKRRTNLQREADFYGAMDGASKFVQGDAVAGIVIALINICAGFVIGVFQHGLTMTESASVFTLLTVGDGLVSQVPALLISSATGIIVTRSSSEANLGANISQQMFRDSRVLGISAGAMLALGLMPGLPKFVFIFLASVMGAGAYFINESQQKGQVAEVEKKKEEDEEKQRKPENVASLLVTDPIELEIGYGLVSLVSKTDGGILERIHLLRKQIALEIGLIVPPIRIRDNIQLKPESYVIKIKGTEVAKNELMAGHYLAMGGGQGYEIPGIQTIDPAFGVKAVWITESQREQAEMAGYMVADVSLVLATHIQEVIKKHAREILGRAEVKTIIDTLKEANPDLVNEIISPDAISLGTLQKVLQNLLEENISIRNMLLILEALGESVEYKNDIDVLTEQVRWALARQISQQLLGSESSINVITIDPELEDKLISSLQRSDKTIYMSLDPQTSQRVAQSASEQVNIARTNGIHPIILVAPGIRPYFRRFLIRSSPNFSGVSVISHNEIDQSVELRAIGMISA
ncbi:MAG TPA: flagellar biosynthesis protein FlhA [Candidatus Wallbacteria bacterium]|nr:flagellar biosynthesis protein FlhA [Candidatus Wallbacteria bacterium]